MTDEMKVAKMEAHIADMAAIPYREVSVAAELAADARFMREVEARREYVPSTLYRGDDRPVRDNCDVLDENETFWAWMTGR